MRRMLCLCLLWLGASVAHGAELRIAAAGSLRHVLPDLVAAYNKDNPSIIIQTRFGSSGQIAKQLMQGAPDQIFLVCGRAFC